MELAQIDVVHIRRWIERTKRAIEVDRRRGEGKPDALRDLHLHDVAIQNVLFALRHSGKIFLLGEFRYRLRYTRRPGE